MWARTFIADSALASAIPELRKALGDDPQKPAYIETIQKRGYRLLSVVVVQAEAEVVEGASGSRPANLGPEDGEAGGRIVAQGTPEDVAQVPASFTGAYLAPLLGIPRAKAS